MTDSWWLKLERAKDHLDEFKEMIAPLLKRCINPVSKAWETYDQAPAFVYRVRFSNPDPDERLPVIAGDFMHNVRSALDHAVVALAPKDRKGKASFPIFTRDIEARDETGKYLHPTDRKNWDKCVKGLPEQAIAFLDLVQPYHGAEREEDPSGIALALLSEFQNADKHRELSVVAQGLVDPDFFFIEPSGVVTKNPAPHHAVPSDSVMRNGAIVNFDRSNPPQKVEMEIEGTPLVVIGRSLDGPVRECPLALDKMLELACKIVHDLSSREWK